MDDSTAARSRPNKPASAERRRDWTVVAVGALFALVTLAWVAGLVIVAVMFIFAVV